MPKIYTISELIRDIKGRLEGNFPEVWLTGQISNLFVSSAGHHYFTLKDEQSQIRTVMFRGFGAQLKFRPEEGLEVLAYGRVSLYEVRGELQVQLEYLEPKGVGALQLAFEQLKKRLEAEGLFDPRRKKPLPFLPRKIGIITSPTGAVVWDMIHILTRRWPNIQILIFPVAVQGGQAAVEIAHGITVLDQRTDLDLLIVGRGGGSVEDLWAFNEEVVARAIAQARLPIISAVGHETDYTIADFVADLRAPTPSAAAELAVPVKQEVLASLLDLRGRLLRAVEQKINQGTLLLRQWRGYLRDPRRMLTETVLKLDHLTTRAGRCLEHFLEMHHERLQGLVQRVGLLDPRNIMKRGYAMVKLSGSSQPLRRAADAKTGDSLQIMLYEGALRAKVTSQGAT